MALVAFQSEAFQVSLVQTHCVESVNFADDTLDLRQHLRRKRRCESMDNIGELAQGSHSWTLLSSLRQGEDATCHRAWLLDLP